MSITSKGKKACVILDNNQVVTKILVLQEVWELEGDMLLKFAVDVAKGTTLFMIDSSTEVAANDDYKAGDYLYFSKGTFKPTRVRFRVSDNICYNYYSEVRFLKDFDNSKMTSLSNLCGGYGGIQNGLDKVKIVDLSYFDTSNITNIYMLFENCQSLLEEDINHFDVRKVTTIGYLFDNCKSLKKVNVSDWATSNISWMRGAFRRCNSLPSLDISKWNTSSNTDFASMFLECTSLTSLDVSNFDTSKATDISYMFYYCTSLTSLDVSNFDTSKVTYMSSVFYYCPSLTSLDVSKFNTENVTLMDHMFTNCTSLTSLDVSNFDTKNVTAMNSMFLNCYFLTSLDVSNFDTSKATDISYMFYNCSSLTNLIFGSKWGTQTSTEANALTLDLSTIGSSKSYKLTDETYNSMLTMYDRASNGLTTMTIKFNKRHNLPDGFAEKMSALGYTITLV